MILLQRTNDKRIMNLREGSDWRKTPKKQLLDKLLNDLETTPKKETKRIQELQRGIDTLQDQRQAWLQKRCELCAKQYGGVTSDYRTLDVPSDISQQTIIQARFISYENENLTIDSRPEYIQDENTILCTNGWVTGNECLLEDDITDFDELELTEPLYFQLWYAQNIQTREISIQLLLRTEEEDFASFPANLQIPGHRNRPICEGRVNLDHSITLGRFE